MTAPSYTARAGSSAVYQYLKSFPLSKGKHSLWTFASKRFLVTKGPHGVWLRTSGLTDTEKSLFMREAKEPRSVKYASALLMPGMTAFDIGANVGYFTLTYAMRVGRNGQVHAFEPTPALARRIRLNATLNRFTNIIINGVAVSDRNGNAQLCISSDDPEANSLSRIDAGTATVDVPTITLDS